MLLVHYPSCNEYLINYNLAVEENRQVCYGRYKWEISACCIHYGDFGSSINSKKGNSINSKRTARTSLIGIASYNDQSCNNSMLSRMFTKATFVDVAEQARATALVKCTSMK